MPPNYSQLLYGPHYVMAFGVDATLTVGTVEYNIRVIDRTIGEMVGSEGSVDVGTIRPTAHLLAADLVALSLDPDDLSDETIAFNGKTWFIKAHYRRPSPNGVLDGEVVLILTEV